MDSTIDEVARTLLCADDPKLIGVAALKLAHSTSPPAHEVLWRALTSTEVLDKLDSPEAYAAEKRLRIWRVLDELAKNSVPSAQALIVTLTQAEAFLAEPARVDRLIAACALVRPAPPQVIRFWNEHWMPDDGYTPLTVAAVIDNSSEPALALFERKMLDPQQHLNDKLSWVDGQLMAHRNEVPILQRCERLLHQPLEEELRIALLRALFQGRPEDVPTDFCVLEPPPLTMASAEALAILRRIGTYVLAQPDLPADLRRSVEDHVQPLSQPAT